jgi:hypothetical protein
MFRFLRQKSQQRYVSPLRILVLSIMSGLEIRLASRVGQVLGFFFEI